MAAFAAIAPQVAGRALSASAGEKINRPTCRDALSRDASSHRDQGE